MNKRPLIIAAALIILSLACNSLVKLTPTQGPPAILHFENEFVAFNYPEGMIVFGADDPAFTPIPNVEMGGQLVIGLADPQEIDKWGNLHRTVGFFIHPVPPGSSLEQVMEAAYRPDTRREGILNASGPVTLAGIPAYQQTYRSGLCGETACDLRDIWAEKGGLIFRVSIWTKYHNPENLAAFQSLADKILDSLVIKEDLPPLVETPTPEPTPSPTLFPASLILHFENDVVAFDYLEELMVYNAGDATFQVYPDFKLGDDLVVGLGDPRFIGFDNYYRSIRILRQTIPAGSNLETIMFDTYREAEKKFPQENGILNANGVITFNGFTAVQRTYRVYSGEPAYELRDIWTQKDNEIFIIAIWTEYTNPDDFAAFEAGADLLLQSLLIK